MDLVALIKHFRIWISSDSLKTLADLPFGVVEGGEVAMVRRGSESFWDFEVPISGIEYIII